MHSCSSKAIYPFHLPSLLKRRFFSSCHRQHPAFCRGRRGEAPGWLLSPVTFISCQFWFSLWRAACANTIWSIAEGGIWIHAMLYIQYIPIECICLFVKAVVLNSFWSIFFPSRTPLHLSSLWNTLAEWHSLTVSGCHYWISCAGAHKSNWRSPPKSHVTVACWYTHPFWLY